MSAESTDDRISDDSQVMQRLSEQGETELSVLFIKVREQLKAMVAARLDRRLSSRVDSSDIVQEVYIRATNGLETFLKSSNVHPYVWLRLICKQIVAETHARHFRAKRSPTREINVDDEYDQLANILVLSSNSVYTELARLELQRKVQELIKDLPSIDREILEMRHTEGMAIVQIAELLEISADAAKKRYYRALTRFRVLFDDDSQGM